MIGAVCSAYVNVRLFRSSESGLLALRTRAFRHVHDLSVLTQNTERRGSLVSRVTSDVDTISLFVQWGGIMLLVSVLQIAVATVLMAVYSWQLTLIVWAGFVPLFVLLQPLQKRVNARYTAVRERVGGMLGAISEAVVGAETIRAYGVAERTQRRIDAAVAATRAAMVRAQNLVALVFSSGVLVANLVLALVVVAGTYLGIAGEMSVGRLLAFLFLVQLFTGPVQMATEILNELQNAVAGWRRVLGVLETPVEVVDAGADGVPSPRGPAHVELRAVDFSYPDGPPVLREVDVAIPAGTSVAVVGATGSGKTTIAKLVARFMDPTRRRRCCWTAWTCGTSPSPTCAAAWCWCRRRASCSTAPSRRTSPTACATRTGRPRRRTTTCGSAQPSRRSAWTAGWTSWPTGSTPRSVSGASRCRRGSGSWSRSPGRTWPRRTCCCSTRRRRRWTRPPRSGSRARWTRSRAAAAP